MNAKKATASQSETPASGMPLFYTKPVLINATEHASAGLGKNLDFSFAAGTTALPINLMEFPQAAHFYPIAFTRDAVATPVAVVGLRDGENLFVKDGQWAQDTYVPAYVRRFPFILSENTENQQLSLCIEDAAPYLIKNGGEKFFDDKQQPTQVAKNAMEFCRSYHMAARQTMALGKALLDAGLLVDRTAEMTLKNGQRISFSGFRIVDEEKFNRLPEKTLVEWRSKGWLAGVYAHLFSGLNWATVTRMANDRVPAAKGGKKR